jgi:hypothetical protein
MTAATARRAAMATTSSSLMRERIERKDGEKEKLAAIMKLLKCHVGVNPRGQ